jgi:serine phosphatase RsbU (regulator of sigma subunit)
MEWILNVNKTLINMGKGQLCTMTMGLIILSKDELQYYCAGHIPLFLVGDKSNRDSVKTITGKGNILGIGPIEVQPVSVDLPKQGDFTLLLGTDGVLDWKTRRNNRSILKIVSDLNREGESALDQRLTEDDKILVRVSRAS